MNSGLVTFLFCLLQSVMYQVKARVSSISRPRFVRCLVMNDSPGTADEQVEDGGMAEAHDLGQKRLGPRGGRRSGTLRLDGCR
jgi:hypothetical protein